MNKIILAGFAIIMACFAQNVQAQNVDEVINKHIEAIGGKDNWAKLKSTKSVVKMKAQGAEINMTMYQVDKKAMKVDIEVMGMKGYQIITDKEGWGFMPWGGQSKAEPMTAEEVKAAQDQLNIQDEFITYKEKGKKLEYVGKDDVEGTECHKLTMTDKEGRITTYYLDASNYQTIKQTVKATINGKEMETTSMFSNYKKFDQGIVLPMNTSGDMGEMEFTSIEINPKIDESIFKPTN